MWIHEWMSSIDIIIHLFTYLRLILSFIGAVARVLPPLVRDLVLVVVEVVVKSFDIMFLSTVTSLNPSLACVRSLDLGRPFTDKFGPHIVNQVCRCTTHTVPFFDFALEFVVLWFLDAIKEYFLPCDRRPVLKFIEAPPARLLIIGPPPLLLVTGPASRLLIAGPPPRLLITGPPSRLLITGPPPRLLIAGPPHRLLIASPPTHLIERPPPSKFITSSPRRLLHGPGPLRLLEAPLVHRLIAGPAIRLLVSALPIRGLLERPPLLNNTPTAGDLAPPKGGAGVGGVRTVSVSDTPMINNGIRGINDQEDHRIGEEELMEVTDGPATPNLAIPSPNFSRTGSGPDCLPGDENAEDSDEYSTPPSSLDNSAPSPISSPDPSDATPPTSPEFASPRPFKTQTLAFLPADDNDADTENDTVEAKPKSKPRRVPFDPLSLFDQENKFLRNLKLDSLVPTAEGGFGKVWRATAVDGNAYALKLIERRPGQEALLRRELRALRYARGSPWTVGMHYVDTAGKYLLLVMDYFDGGDLMDLWEDIAGPFDRDLAIFWAAELILALHDLHLRGIVHRDIKFENLMLDDGHIRIIDFGLAITFDHDKVSKEPAYEMFRRLKAAKYDSFPPLQHVKCNPHILVGPTGTPGYIPPEVLAQRGYSFGVDYYAMGVVLHGMLTDSLPYVLCEELEAYDYTMLCIDPDEVLSPAERDFIEQVLSPNPHNRPSLRRMKAHPIFSHIDWDALSEGKLDPPGYH